MKKVAANPHKWLYNTIYYKMGCFKKWLKQRVADHGSDFFHRNQNLSVVGEDFFVRQGGGRRHTRRGMATELLDGNKKGKIALPMAQRMSGHRRSRDKYRQMFFHDETPIEASLPELRPLKIAAVEAPSQVNEFKSCIEQFHYLGKPSKIWCWSMVSFDEPRFFVAHFNIGDCESKGF